MKIIKATVSFYLNDDETIEDVRALLSNGLDSQDFDYEIVAFEETEFILDAGEEWTSTT
jgi:hypothetical protein